MRHGKKFNHLGRTAPHRKAMLSNMATSLILNKRITTTVAKAKALRKYVEPILTRAKDDTTHSRRVVFSYLNNKESVKTLFDEVATKIADRPGGYTRILKTGSRLGDNADMCIIELVDYNELLLGDTAKKTKTRRSRRGKGASSAPKDSKPVAVEEKTQESPVEEAVVEDAVEAVETEAEVEAQETPVEEAVVEETPVTEEVEEPKAESDQVEEETETPPPAENTSAEEEEQGEGEKPKEDEDTKQ
ncbi:MAG: 50S ribosomal protein L17 [Cytophagales bacterium]|nr:50S ribosomal protein L17 [Cytophagales bacterium]